MRSVHGTFATLLLMVPVLSIPALAIFGIPQFAPVVASPLDEGAKKATERRVGQSARQTNDNMEDFEDAPLFGSEPDEPGTATPAGRIGDSVPITRPGRSNRDSKERQNADLKVNPRGKMPPSKAGWLDEFEEPQTEPEVSRNAPSPGFDFRDNPPSSRSQPGDLSRGPKAFQRRREQQPEPAPKGSNALDIEPLTWQSAVRKLNELEIRNFRLQPGHRENQFLFICSYTPSDSPRLSYRYEAEADEPLKAVEKVLEQILESQQRR